MEDKLNATERVRATALELAIKARTSISSSESLMDIARKFETYIETGRIN